MRYFAQKIMLGVTLAGLLFVAAPLRPAVADDGDKSASDKAADAAKAEEKKGEEKKTEKAGKKATVVTLVIKDDLPEGTGSAGLFGELTPRLREVIERLDKVAKDDKISAVLLELRGPEIGLGKVNELRGAIARVRKAGKKVYADVPSATSKDYLVASACDVVVMPPSGALAITGLRAEVQFFKGLFDKLGVQADFIQIGEFKGAAEPYTRTEMSPEFRKQFEHFLDDNYEYLVTTIASDRKLEPQKVRDLIDEGLLTAARGKELGLIDRVAYGDQLRDELKTDLGADEVTVQRDYGKKQVDTDFSGLGGFMKLMEVMMGGQPNAKKSKSKTAKIAVIYAVGEITDSEGTTSMLSEEGVTTDKMLKALRQAQADDNVKSIVLRVDSPGGSALASDLIWRDIVRSKKPVVASMGDIAASGGYYISMGCKKIYAEPGTLTGSIGVVGGKVAIKGLLDKVGVHTDVIYRGKNSGTFSMTDPFTPGEKDAWKRLMTDVYRQFTTKAAEGRHMDVAKLEELAAGRIFTGRQAVENGLVDKLGTLEDAIAEAKSLAGLKAEDKVDIMVLPEPKSFLEQLLSGPSLESEAKFPGAALLGPQVISAFRQLQTLQRLFREPAVTVMPFRVEIK